MEFISNVIAWSVENWAVIAGIAGAAHVLALAIVNVTKTPKDNEILAKVYAVLSFVGGLVTKEARGVNADGAPKV